MSRKQIVLIGCGNIGSRHLQAVAKLPFPCTVQVVEPSESSQELAKSRLAEVTYDRDRHDFHWHKSTQDLKEKSDLTIVSTSAAGRAAAVTDLVNAGHSRFLIEKMVCQSVAEYQSLLSTIETSGGKAWVNAPRRYYRSYLRIREHFHGHRPLQLSVVAGNEGLGTNAIHFLDLFSWFCRDYNLKLVGDLLFEKLFPNKRGHNFLEFAGAISGTSSNGSSLNISFLPLDEQMPLTVNIISRDANVVINETDAKIINLIPKNPSPEAFQNEFVSETTTRIACDIISSDSCCLASLEESFFVHSELFRIFNAHIEKLTGEKKELCPIT